MDLLLTSAGIRNPSIEAALVDLLGKPIEESTALFVPAGIYPFPGGAFNAVEAMRGGRNRLCDLNWKSLGLLELSALPTIKRDSWVPTVKETDALLVWGGNVLYLYYWMKKSGLADLFSELNNLVYVGVSAGSIVMTPFNCDVDFNRQWVPEGSDIPLDDPRGLGVVDSCLWVHVGNPDPIFEDHNLANVERWAGTVDVPVYALDDESALKVRGGKIDVVSEGNWEVFGQRRSN